MERFRNRLVGATVGIVATLIVGADVSGGGQEASATEGWVQLPTSGDNSAKAFAVVRNPTMYDVYVVSAVSEAAAKVEFREKGGGEAKAVPELTVPAYGKLTMGPDGAHLVLVDLKNALEEDDSVTLTLTTDGNVKLRVEAIVRAE